MNEREIFDTLKNADEETMSRLSDTPVLSDEEKERIFRASKRKADKAAELGAGGDITVMENDIAAGSGETARIVEVKQRRFAVMNIAAACVILALCTAAVMNGVGSYRDKLSTDSGSGSAAASSAPDSGTDKAANDKSAVNDSKTSVSVPDYPYDASSMTRVYKVSGMAAENEEYVDFDITDEEQLDRIDAVLDEIDRIKGDCVRLDSYEGDDTPGLSLSVNDDVKYFISMVGDHPSLTINFIDYDIPQELIDSLMAAIAPTSTGQYAQALVLMDALCTIDELSGGVGVAYNADVTLSGDEGYALINDCGFGSVADIDSYLHENLTDDFINARYYSITGTDRPMYTDYDGDLYIDTYALHDSGFTWTDTELTIADVTASSFTATAEFYTSRGTAQLKLSIINDGGLWKIAAIEYL